MWRFLICLMPTLALAQVEQGAPNADFAPAFEGQTRAPSVGPSVISVEVFASGFDFPWGIAPLPDGRFLVSERGGEMHIVGADGARLGEVSGVPDVAARNQGGLLDVAVSPDFETDGVVYWTYAKPVDGGSALAAGRGVFVDGALTQAADIFVQTPAINSNKHFGSRVVAARGGVWITAGDRGNAELAQNGETTVGKVMWVEDGGTPAIWSTGHRNIQGAILRDGDLWTVEHGPRGGDELNRPEFGANYGWPVVSYGINYSGSDVGEGIAVADGYEQPVYYWDPVIAPGGMAAYPDDGPYRDWRGDLFVASLFPGGVVRLKIEGGRVIGEERLLADIGRVRDVEVLENGDLLVLPDVRGGDILRVTPVQ
ncbi:PQQ-dependent sugar dehydrogenase [Octadecabacter sp. G9-8]|uniref:PQQ-dependent sugar dehydrogenase n=1 Tax=Octadecabacter dasysiphoniae TaxID=2909341 RepID=A0ABS9CVU0_9RHOB|nr:PQQ-dependent sugar dehydrogenase [Octadecabacter dasysiphoniae]MCF2871401.1 PQQ-dependent sugar dehydrogenase [Octadecabacter dasysiphoniae]